MSLGSYPLREDDPWGAPDYGKPFAEYGEKITADPRSPRRNLDGFSDYAEVVGFSAALERRGYSTEDIAKDSGRELPESRLEAWKA